MEAAMTINDQNTLTEFVSLLREVPKPSGGSPDQEAALRRLQDWCNGKPGRRAWLGLPADWNGGLER